MKYYKLLDPESGEVLGYGSTSGNLPLGAVEITQAEYEEAVGGIENLRAQQQQADAEAMFGELTGVGLSQETAARLSGYRSPAESEG